MTAAWLGHTTIVELILNAGFPLDQVNKVRVCMELFLRGE